MTRVEQFERIRRDRRLEGLSIRELARKHKVGSSGMNVGNFAGTTRKFSL